MSVEVSQECPENILSALEDITIEIKLIEQMILGIATLADSVSDPVLEFRNIGERH